MKFRFSVLAAVALSVLLAPAAFAGDAANGRTLAEEKCKRCHDIEKGGAFKKHPPSFQAVAIYRTPEDIWSRIIAPSPHSGMPEMQWSLLPNEVQDLVAYITSLDVPVTLQQ